MILLICSRSIIKYGSCIVSFLQFDLLRLLYFIHCLFIREMNVNDNFSFFFYKINDDFSGIQ